MKIKTRSRSIILASAFLILFLICISSVASAAQATRIGSGADPAIYGSNVVWTNGGVIHLYDLTSKTDTTVSSSAASYPAIYGNKLVWHDESSGTPRLTVYDIPSGSRAYITTDVDSSSIPAIYGNIIVWSANYNESNNNYNVYMRDISTSTQTKIAEGNSPDIYDTKITYGYENVNVDGRTIAVYDINTKETINVYSSSQIFNPHIYGNKVIWSDFYTRSGYIQMYDLVTKQTIDVTSDNTGNTLPEYANYSYFDAGDDTGTHTNINGDKIVYSKGGNDQFGYAGVYFYDIPSAKSTPVYIYPEATNTAPHIYNDNIVWGIDSRFQGTANDNGIYMSNLSVTNTSPPVAEFTANTTYGAAPLVVLFIDTSIGGVPTSWIWDFGDGNNSIEQNPMHTYSAVSISTKVLLVSAAPESFASPLEMYLRSAPDISSVDFFDATASTPTLAQLQAYDAVLVWSDMGYQDPIGLGDVLADYVDKGGHVVVSSFSFANNGLADLQGRLISDGYSPLVSARSTLYSSSTMDCYDSTNPIMSGVSSIGAYYRDDTTLTNGASLVSKWADGKPLVAVKGNVVAISLYPGVTGLSENDWTGDVPRLMYNALVIGKTSTNYIVNLTVSNTNGADSKIATIIVLQPLKALPVAKFSSNVTSGLVPLSVQFYDNSENSTGWSWDFGDGATSNDQNPIHTYSVAGNYAVTLTVNNSSGSNTMTKHDYIIASTPVTPPSGPIYNSGNGHYYELINMPEGITWEDAKNAAQSSSYSGMNGHLATIDSEYENDFIVNNLNPNYHWLGSFQPDGSVEPNGGWQWLTGEPWDYTNWDSPEPNEYDNNGEDRLQIYANGYWNDISHSALNTGGYIVEYEEQRLPVANFITNVTTGNVPLSVQFTDLSENAIEWNWNFGDGNTSTEQNPTHTYYEAGEYTVTLMVSDIDGISSKLSTITVLGPRDPEPPVENAPNVSAPVNVQIGNLSQNANEINWNIGSQHMGTNFSVNGQNVSAPVTVQIGNASQNAITINWNIHA